MMKFIKSHMATIDGVEIFPIISLVIFFVFFTLLLIYVVRFTKERVKEVEQLPLEDGTTEFSPFNT